MKRVAMIFPYAPSYREAVYRKIDKEWNVDWYFAGNAKPGLRQLDYSILDNCHLDLKEIRLGPFNYLKGWSKIDFSSYDAVVIPGVFRLISDMLIITRLAKKAGVRVYLWTHGWYGKETRMEKYIKHKIYPMADGIFLYGTHARNLMLEEGFDGKRLHVIYNSLDYARHLAIRKELYPNDIYRHHFGNADPVLIFIGRLTEVKKLWMLPQAMSILQSRGKHYNLVMVGDGEYRSRFEEEVRKYGLEKKVWMVGESFDEANNAGMIYNADLCVSPGNVGLTSVHSVTMGCPVLTNDNFNTQMPEFEVVKDGKSGTFFRENDVDDLAMKIEGWIDANTSRREEVRRQCYNIIDSNWNPDYQIKILKEVIG